MSAAAAVLLIAALALAAAFLFARRPFFGACADVCRALGRWSLFVPKVFDRMADWFTERAR